MPLRIVVPLCIALLAGSVDAQIPQCDISERECLDELISSQCMSLESDAQSCSAFRELLTNSPQAGQPTIRAHVGASYLMQAARTPNQDERSALQDHAEQTLLEVLNVDPANDDALNALSALEARRGNFQGAADYYRIVYESRPNSPTVHRAYVAYLSQSGDESPWVLWRPFGLSYAA